MAALRKVNKKDIVHNLQEGTKYTYKELSDLARLNPNWFLNFPLPSNNQSKAESDTKSFASEPLDTSVKPEINKINHIFYDFKDLTPLKILSTQRKDSE